MKIAIWLITDSGSHIWLETRDGELPNAGDSISVKGKWYIVVSVSGGNVYVRAE